MKNKALACAAALAIFAGSCPQAQSVGFIGFYFFGQAMQGLGFRAFGALSQAPVAVPNWAVSSGAASLINDQLPILAADGFSITMARSPAPGALEIYVEAPKGKEPTPEELDRAWGPGIIDMFCGADDTLWTRWVRIGGTAGIMVRNSSGDVVRQYGATAAECAAIAARHG